MTSQTQCKNQATNFLRWCNNQNKDVDNTYTRDCQFVLRCPSDPGAFYIQEVPWQINHTKSIKNFSVLGIVRAKDGAYTYGTNDAYAIAIMFALLLSKSDLKDFISSMRTAFGKLQKQLHTISATDIMSIMGYDANWTNLANLI